MGPGQPNYNGNVQLSNQAFCKTVDSRLESNDGGVTKVPLKQYLRNMQQQTLGDDDLITKGTVSHKKDSNLANHDDGSTSMMLL